MKKLFISLLAVIVIIASVAFGWFMAKNSVSSDDTTSANVQTDENSDETDEKTSDDTDYESTVETSSATKTDGEGSLGVYPTDAETISKLILGEWTDNANFSGYEFMEDGIMKITYFNMALLELDDVISGTYTGTYKIEGNKITVSYTIYSKAVTKTYTVNVDDNTLTLKDEKGESAIYVRKDASTKMDDVDKKLLGSWKSNLNGYEFMDTGVVAITFIDLSSMGINLPINGTVNGVYTLDGNKLSVKYSIYTGVIEKNFKYEIDGKVLTLTDLSSGDVGTYIKDDSTNE